VSTAVECGSAGREPSVKEHCSLLESHSYHQIVVLGWSRVSIPISFPFHEGLGEGVLGLFGVALPNVWQDSEWDW